MGIRLAMNFFRKPVVLFLLFIIIFVAGFLGGVEYEKRMLYRYTLLIPGNISPEELSQYKSDEYGVKGTCPYYGQLDKNLFLPSYTVKKGDSLLSVASRQYGGPNGIKTIVALNKDRYKSLTVSSPFIEVGWKLFMLPSYLTSQEYDLQAFAGEYGKKHVSGIIDLQTPHGGSMIEPNSETVYPYDKEIKEGDCVVSITSWEPGNVKNKAVYLQKWITADK